MMALLLLGVVSAILLRSQVVFEKKFYNTLTLFVSNIVVISLPFISLFSGLDLGQDWRELFYYISYALFCVMLITLSFDWHKNWSLILLWPLLPFIYTSSSLSLWLSLITGEFLLLMAFLEHPFKSDYHKLAMLRILVIFQYFVFDYLFIYNRVAFTAQFMAIFLIILYSLSLFDLSSRIRLKRPQILLFVLTFIQFGVMMFDKVVFDVFGLNS
jgi:hypothetical protein